MIVTLNTKKTLNDHNMFVFARVRDERLVQPTVSIYCSIFLVQRMEANAAQANQHEHNTKDSSTHLGAAGPDASPGKNGQPGTTNPSRLRLRPAVCQESSNPKGSVAVSLNHYIQGCAKIPMPALALARVYFAPTATLPRAFLFCSHRSTPSSRPCGSWIQRWTNYTFSKHSSRKFVDNRTIIPPPRGQQGMLRVHHVETRREWVLRDKQI